MQRDTTKKTILVSLILCLACSSLVSISAVGLKSRQLANQELERKKNILVAAGLFDPELDSIDKVPELFKRIKPVLIDLITGEQVDAETFEKLGGDNFNQKKAIKNPELSTMLAADVDLPGIKQRENYAWLYQVEAKKKNAIEQYVIPIRGKGLWSTLWGFISLDADLKTIKGLAFYKHGETPGLGGEIESEKFKSAWKGKVAYDNTWEIQIELPKQISEDESLAKHQVESIPGATITSRGVQQTLHFWLGDNGFGKYLKKLRAENQLSQQFHFTPTEEGKHG